MKEQLDQRLEELRKEFEAGQKMLSEMEIKQANLRESLLRISGAIQVLEELNGSDLNEKGAEINKKRQSEEDK